MPLIIFVEALTSVNNLMNTLISLDKLINKHKLNDKFTKSSLKIHTNSGRNINFMKPIKYMKERKKKKK